MSQYSHMFARPSDIIAAARKIFHAKHGRRLGRGLAANVRREARAAGYSFRALRAATGLSVFSLARLWFAGRGSAVDLVSVQNALGASYASIWGVR